MPRKYDCPACGGKHEKPVGRRCIFLQQQTDSSSEASSDIVLGQTARDDDSNSSKDYSEKIFEKLVNMEGKLDTLDRKVEQNSLKIADLSCGARDSRRLSTSSAVGGQIQQQDVVVPSVQALQVPHIQAQVDQRMRELGHLPDSKICCRVLG